MITAHMIFGVLVGTVCGVMMLVVGSNAIFAVSAYSIFGATGLALSALFQFYTTDA